MKGIDVSNHNGTIDFESVKNSGVEVVIIKATEGVDFVDDLLEQHYNGANGVIPHIGFYHFMSEKTDPSQQAEDFYNAIKGKAYDVKPCLDIEVNNYGRSAAEITDRCLEFIKRFKELSGQDIIIYTGGYFGRDNLDSRIKCYGGWIAHYGVDSPMETGFPLIGHQYSESESVSGIDGNVDMNNFYEGIFMNGNMATPRPVVQDNYEYDESGTASVCVDKLNVRTSPSLNGEIVATYNYGEEFTYNHVVIAENYTWVRYVGSASGQYRYVAVKNLAEDKRYANCY
ncbi:GH25 family lysozyme [Clostridium sp. HBUAS56017]|uniref:GH25 family lysozyme n=1 Tax=Clostridium sp. HBUAS56017 TaxID=2571128 RepID=UPI00163DC941|nr:GH25 family lysozyme [Clostridium sp. HBUAS56017]